MYVIVNEIVIHYSRIDFCFIWLILCIFFGLANFLRLFRSPRTKDNKTTKNKNKNKNKSNNTNNMDIPQEEVVEVGVGQEEKGEGLIILEEERSRFSPFYPSLLSSLSFLNFFFFFFFLFLFLVFSFLFSELLLMSRP